MFASLRQGRTLYLLIPLAIGMATGAPGAESPAPASSPAGSTGSLPLTEGAGDSGEGGNFGDVSFSNPTLQPGGPVPKNIDRQRSSAAATALASSVAGWQRLACITLMLNPLTIGLALLECAQAAQTEADAKKNRDAERKNRDENAIPEQAQLTLPKPFELRPQKRDDDPRILRALAAAQPTPDSSPVFEPPPDVSAAAPQASALPSPSQAANDAPETQAPISTPAPKPNSLQLIDRAKLGYDQNGKDSSKPPPTSPFYPPLGERGTANYADARIVSTADLQGRSSTEKALRISLQGTDRNGRKLSTPPEGAASGAVASGDNESAKGSSGGDGFDLISQLLGGAPPGESAPEASGSDVIILPVKKYPLQKDPNIFEYASWRYRKIARPDPGVRVHSPRRPATLERGRRLARIN